MRRLVAAGSVLFLCGLLAGCAPATTTPHAAASSVAPTPTPTPTAVADPKIRVPLSCATLFTTSAVSALLGTTATLAVDESTAPTDLDGIAQVQRGILTCTWGGKDKTDSGFDQALSVYVEPDATRDFTTNFPAVKHNFGKPVVGTYGDQSAYACESGGGIECGANVLVGGYWLTVDLHDLDSSHDVPKATAVLRLKSILNTTVTALKGAGDPSPTWTAPADGLLPFCVSPASTAAVRKAFDSKGLVSASDDPGSGQDVSTIGQTGDSFARCDWEQKAASVPKGQYSDVTLEILDRGVWALPGFVANPPTQWYVGTYKPVSIPGADNAVLACNNADCDAIFGIGSNAIEVGFSDLGSARNTAALTAFASVVAGM
jgi:hypothetical protein